MNRTRPTPAGVQPRARASASGTRGQGRRRAASRRNADGGRASRGGRAGARNDKKMRRPTGNRVRAGSGSVLETRQNEERRVGRRGGRVEGGPGRRRAERRESPGRPRESGGGKRVSPPKAPPEHRRSSSRAHRDEKSTTRSRSTETTWEEKNKSRPQANVRWFSGRGLDRCAATPLGPVFPAERRPLPAGSPRLPPPTPRDPRTHGRPSKGLRCGSDRGALAPSHERRHGKRPRSDVGKPWTNVVHFKSPRPGLFCLDSSTAQISTPLRRPSAAYARRPGLRTDTRELPRPAAPNARPRMHPE